LVFLSNFFDFYIKFFIDFFNFKIYFLFKDKSGKNLGIFLRSTGYILGLR
jgi:hypothetical protein